jgi:hypothetical protein
MIATATSSLQRLQVSGRVLTFVIVVLSGTTLAASAQDCPTEQAGRRGFVVERGDKQKSDILHTDGGIVHTVMRYNGVALLETMQYEGLFQLDRLEEGRRTKFKPRTNLKALFPLKPKQTVKAEFTWEREGQNGVLLVQMAVKGFEDLYIGPCKYSVLKIERSEAGTANPPRFLYSEYYSPVLKLSLAKEYRYANGRTQIIKFDRIYLKPPTPGAAAAQAQSRDADDYNRGWAGLDHLSSLLKEILGGWCWKTDSRSRSSEHQFERSRCKETGAEPAIIIWPNGLYTSETGECKTDHTLARRFKNDPTQYYVVQYYCSGSRLSVTMFLENGTLFVRYHAPSLGLGVPK